MSDSGHLSQSLQMSVLVALCFDDGYGAEIASQVKTTHFDNVYRDFVAGVLRYRKEYKKPPGAVQILGIAEEAALSRDSKTLYVESLVPALIAEESGFNAQYTASRVHDFIRHQQAKQALFEAGDAWDAERNGGPNAVPKIEKIFSNFIHVPVDRFSAGTMLTDLSALKFLDRRNEDFIPIGISQLDAARVGLYPKQLLLYIAPKGSGKTWFCVHCGVNALMHHYKVLHVTLEEDGDTGILPRYYQRLFGVGQNNDMLPWTTFNAKKAGTVFNTERRRPPLHFGQAGIKKRLAKEMAEFARHYGKLIIKTFPTSQLTVDAFISYLDYLELVLNFVPSLVIIDYPKLMKTDPSNLRVSLGRIVEELRGVSFARNMALLCPHQGTRATLNAARVRSKDAGEDISVVQTADTVLSFQRTDMEESLGLGRVSVEHCRNARDGWMIWISQAYGMGKYCVDSRYMGDADWKELKTLQDREGGGSGSYGE